MPIINQVVAGSGGSSVSEPYVNWGIDANGVMVNNSSHIVDLTGVKTVAIYAFASSYTNNTNISGTVDFSDVFFVRQYGFNAMFMDCTGLTRADLSGLFGDGTGALDSMFRGCTNLVSIDLKNARTIHGQSLCNGCTNLTSFDLSKFQSCYDSNSFGYAFQGCTSLVNASFQNAISLFQFSSTFSGCTSLQSLDISNCYYLDGNSMCYNCPNVTTVKMDKIAKIKSMSQAFRGCTALTTLSFPGLPFGSESATNNNLANMLIGCSDVTVHFPAEWETTMQSWSNVQNGFGGTNTTVLFDLPNVTTINISLPEKNLYATGVFYGVFKGCVNITSASCDVEYCDSSMAFNSAFSGCTALTSLDLSSLIHITDEGNLINAFAQSQFASVCDGCTALTSVNLSSLRQVKYSNTFQNAFRNTALTSLSLPALNVVTNNAFSNALSGVTGCTVHLPANLSGRPFNFGGTNTTVVFDLPSTFILTGANDVEYERNPKYDTATALAWRVKDTGTLPDVTVDWTPFYTSGTTDPSVSDAIYSDAACTTSVTTITAIA